MIDDLHWWGIGQIRRAFADGSLTPSDLMAYLLDRIDRLDPHLHAIVDLDRAAVIADAWAATLALRQGDVVGPLHGVPVGIKDIIDVAGRRTTCHSRFMLDNVATLDAAMVSGLRRSGAIIMAKLATHEFAIGGPSFDLPFPPARNPWNPDHHPGGSSTGSGVAVAAGLMPAALGTDTAGSIRNPASGCGIVGLKPTYGLLSMQGIFPLAPSLDHVGPMTRTVADAARMFSVLANTGPIKLDGGVAGLRIGFVRHFHERDLPATAEVVAGLDQIVASLAAAGAMIVDVTLPPLSAFASTNLGLMQAEAYGLHADRLHQRPGDFAERTRRALLPGADFDPAALGRLQADRHLLTAAMEGVFTTVDLMVMASSLDVPARFDDEAGIDRGYGLQARTPFNLTGHPALAMMAGLSATGLPLSVQFAARRYEEAMLLRAAHCWEQMAGLPRHPTLPSLGRGSAPPHPVTIVAHAADGAA